MECPEYHNHPWQIEARKSKTDTKEHICRWCSSKFIPKNDRQEFCSQKCYEAHEDAELGSRGPNV